MLIFGVYHTEELAVCNSKMKKQTVAILSSWQLGFSFIQTVINDRFAVRQSTLINIDCSIQTSTEKSSFAGLKESPLVTT